MILILKIQNNDIKACFRKYLNFLTKATFSLLISRTITVSDMNFIAGKLCFREARVQIMIWRISYLEILNSYFPLFHVLF